jgi:transposase-like protein
MDGSGAIRRSHSKKGATTPQQDEECKLGISPSFQLAVKEIIRDWARSDDMDDLQHQLFAEFGNFRLMKLRVGRVLSGFRDGLHHGGWMPLINAAALELGVDEGTVRRWVASYERRDIVIPPPAEIGVDVESDQAQRSETLELVRGTAQGTARGLCEEEATEEAKALAPLHQPPPPAVHPLTAREQWVRDYRTAGRPALGKVPEKEKVEVIAQSAAEEIWLMTGRREPITITPHEPVVDLSGRRYQAQEEETPEP